MELLIPKDKAIKILQDRLAEINHFDFNPKAWKSKTENDLQEIFKFGLQWLQISNISFDTFITAEKNKALNEGKDTARKLIASYIEFIQEHSRIAEEKQIMNEKYYEEKYDNLVVDWNNLVPSYKALEKKYNA